MVRGAIVRATITGGFFDKGKSRMMLSSSRDDKKKHLGKGQELRYLSRSRDRAVKIAKKFRRVRAGGGFLPER